MCNQLSQTIPSETTDDGAFAEQLIEIANRAGTALMISIGHRTGLFDVLSELDPQSCSEIADAARLDERYVREWLAAMAVAGIVLYDPVRKQYRLPEEHAAFLTRRAAPDNLAVLMQYFSVLGGVEDQIVDCFHKGGGVPYEEFNRFHEVVAEDSGQVVESVLLEHVVPLVPGLSDRLEKGIDVLDVGCGSGRAMIRLAEAFPKSRFVGCDFSLEAIERASSAAQNRGLTNVRFEARDAIDLVSLGQFDLITTFDAIHDQAHPERVLAKIHDALRPEGIYLMQDIAGSSHLENNFDHPIAPLLYTISCMHCMTVSLAHGGAGLGTMWGEEKALSMLAEARFESVEVHRLDGDFLNNYYIAYPAAD